MRPLRISVALAGLMIASAAIAPSVGAYKEAARSGTDWGDPITVNDNNGAAGVKCLYENNRGKKHDELNKIRIVPQFFHGPFDATTSHEKTYVGYRFIVKRNKPPLGDGKYKTIFRSKILKKLANQAEVANFKSRVWKAPENTKSRYRVQLILLWYAPGSKANVIGRTRGIMEVYDQKMKPKRKYTRGVEGSAGFCNRNWNYGAP